MTGPESDAGDAGGRISPAVRALRDALPGIHVWFSRADLERAVAGVRAVVEAELMAKRGMAPNTRTNPRSWRCWLGWHAWLAVPHAPPPYPPRDLTVVDYAGFTVFCARCGVPIQDRARERRARVIDQQWGMPRGE